MAVCLLSVPRLAAPLLAELHRRLLQAVVPWRRQPLRAPRGQNTELIAHGAWSAEPRSVLALQLEPSIAWRHAGRVGWMLYPYVVKRLRLFALCS